MLQGALVADLWSEVLLRQSVPHLEQIQPQKLRLVRSLVTEDIVQQQLALKPGRITCWSPLRCES